MGAHVHPKNDVHGRKAFLRELIKSASKMLQKCCCYCCMTISGDPPGMAGTKQNHICSIFVHRNGPPSISTWDKHSCTICDMNIHVGKSIFEALSQRPTGRITANVPPKNDVHGRKAFLRDLLKVSYTNCTTMLSLCFMMISGNPRGMEGTPKNHICSIFVHRSAPPSISTWDNHICTICDMNIHAGKSIFVAYM